MTYLFTKNIYGNPYQYQYTYLQGPYFDFHQYT